MVGAQALVVREVKGAGPCKGTVDVPLCIRPGAEHGMHGAAGQVDVPHARPECDRVCPPVLRRRRGVSHFLRTAAIVQPPSHAYVHIVDSQIGQSQSAIGEMRQACTQGKKCTVAGCNGDGCTQMQPRIPSGADGDGQWTVNGIVRG